MAAPQMFEISLVSVRGIGIKPPFRAFSLSNAIGQAEELLQCPGALSYDKIWRAVKKVGAYSFVLELPRSLAPNAPTLAVLIIAPEDYANVEGQQHKVRKYAKPVDAPQVNTDTYTWVNEGPAAAAAQGAPVSEEEPIPYAFRVFYSKINFITKRPNKKEYSHEVLASSEADAVKLFEFEHENLTGEKTVIRRVEVAGSL